MPWDQTKILYNKHQLEKISIAAINLYNQNVMSDHEKSITSVTFFTEPFLLYTLTHPPIPSKHVCGLNESELRCCRLSIQVLQFHSVRIHSSTASVSVIPGRVC